MWVSKDRRSRPTIRLGWLEVSFADISLDKLEVEPRFDGGFPAVIVKSYRKRMQMIRAAEDERAFYALKSLHFEKLKGDRSHQHSMRLNDQWRLIVEIRRSQQDKKVHVVGIEDYH